MKHFINLKDIPSKDLKKILEETKKRKKARKKLNTLDTDKEMPLKGKLLIQMFEKPSLRTRLSFFLAFFLFFVSFKIFLRSFAGISLIFIKCFINYSFDKLD